MDINTYSNVINRYPQYKPVTIPPNKRKSQQYYDGFERRSNVNKEQTIQIDPKLRQDLDKVKDKTQMALCFFPLLRKVFSVINDFNGNDYPKLMGDLIRLINDSPEDWKDSKNSLKPCNIENFEAQRPFSFTRGTIVSRTKLAPKLQKYDYTLFDFQKYKLFLKKIGMKNYKVIDGKVVIDGSIASKVLGRAGLRITYLGFGAASSLEAVHVLYSKDKKHEAVKSAISILSVTGCMSILGAVGAFYCPLLGFMGMWGGYLLGKKITKISTNSIFQSPKSEKPC